MKTNVYLFETWAPNLSSASTLVTRLQETAVWSAE
jgi:hypothetical protein